MKVKVLDKKKEYALRTGDVVSVDDHLYLITKESKGYIAKSFDGECGSTGYHDTLDNLHVSLRELNVEFVHYNKEEFELQLKRK